MAAERLTRQGVRALDPVGYNGRRKHGFACRHWFTDPIVVIGHRWAVDRDYFEAYEEPIYGRRCMYCTETKEIL